MTIRIELGAEERCRAIVEGSMTIYEAAGDKSVLLGALARVKEAEIDLSTVREMDTAGLQILVLARRESLKAGKTLRLIALSPAALDVLERYGLGSYFGDSVGDAIGERAREPALDSDVARRASRKPRPKPGVKSKGKRAP